MTSKLVKLLQTKPRLGDGSVIEAAAVQVRKPEFQTLGPMEM